MKSNYSADENARNTVPETAGLELDKTLFEKGDPAGNLQFAPSEDDLPDVNDHSIDEESLAFDDLTVIE